MSVHRMTPSFGADGRTRLGTKCQRAPTSVSGTSATCSSSSTSGELLRDIALFLTRSFSGNLLPCSTGELWSQTSLRPIEIPVYHRKQLGGLGRDYPDPGGHGTYAPGTLVLGKDYVQFEEPAPGKHNFKVRPTKITRLRQAKLRDREAGDPRFSFLVLHFSRKTPAGSKITFQLHSSNVIPLLKCVISMSPNVKFK